MRYEFTLVDVFTDRPFAGNQLAVLSDARGLTDDQMQAIAREFNFAETAFFLPGVRPGSTGRLRIFTPLTEMPFAGHPTVGSAAVLVHRSVVETRDGSAEIVFDEGVGPVSVSVSRGDCGTTLISELRLSASLVSPDTEPDTGELAACLRLDRSAVTHAWFGSVGAPFCFAQLRAPADVDRAEVDLDAWSRTLRQAWAPNIFVYAGELTDGASVYSRMFGPTLGVAEDPATGSAAAVLVARVAELAQPRDGVVRIAVTQGVKLGRPSEIEAEASTLDGRLQHVGVRGRVTVVGGGYLDVAQRAHDLVDAARVDTDALHLHR